jgi:hypothetical protein
VNGAIELRKSRRSGWLSIPLTAGIQRKKVNWVLDADIRGFYNMIFVTCEADVADVGRMDGKQRLLDKFEDMASFTAAIIRAQQQWSGRPVLQLASSGAPPNRGNRMNIRSRLCGLCGG